MVRAGYMPKSLNPCIRLQPQFQLMIEAVIIPRFTRSLLKIQWLKNEYEKWEIWKLRNMKNEKYEKWEMSKKGVLEHYAHKSFFALFFMLWYFFSKKSRFLFQNLKMDKNKCPKMKRGLYFREKGRIFTLCSQNVFWNYILWA